MQNALAVDMLNVERLSPPVPQVSTNLLTSSRLIFFEYWRIIFANPKISSTVSDLKARTLKIAAVYSELNWFSIIFFINFLLS